MSESPKRDPHGTPVTGWSLPIAYWQDAVESARDRVAELRAADGSAVMPPRSSTWMLEELSTTLEHLSVAEQELHVQNDELQAAQTALWAERERYRELFEHAPVSYIVTDGFGNILDANRAVARLLRVRVDRLIGKPFAVFAQDVTRRRLRSALNALRHDRQSITVRLNITNRCGSARRLEAMIAAARTPRGELIELRWLLVDQTRRARRERSRRAHAEELEKLVSQRTAELEDSQRQKDRLVATVSHEFRTALAAIGGYAEMLEMGVRGPLTDLQRADVGRIRGAYEHLTKVVDDLLSYSKLVGNQLPLDICDLSLADALRGVDDLVAPQARDKHIGVDVAIPAGELIVRADGARLRQVVLNLLGNAVKFTPSHGDVRLRCRAEASEVFVEVSDSGPGIPEEQRESIFEPFVRLRTHQGTLGTGLGLAISRSFARAMGGDLTVGDGAGGGSCFVLRLDRSTPLADVDSAATH